MTLMTRWRSRAASRTGALGVSLAVAVVAAPPVRAAAPARPGPAARAAAALARRGLMGRSDLGVGWSRTTPAPKNPSSLTCGSDPGVLAAVASATWSQTGATAFASAASYGFADVARQRRAWRATAARAMGPCLEHLLQAGSGHGVQLRATGVRPLPALRIGDAAAGASVRRYEVSGTASGAGQDVPVTLDVVLVSQGTWIGEDEFSAAGSTPSARLQTRVVEHQAGRVS